MNPKCEKTLPRSDNRPPHKLLLTVCVCLCLQWYPNNLTPPPCLCPLPDAPVGSPSPPTTISHPTAPSAVAVTLSQPLTLECVVTRAGGVGAGATPELRWLKDGRLLELGETRSLRHANLVLGSVKRSDAGEYRCSVQTEQGTQTGSNYTVTVLGRAARDSLLATLVVVVVACGVVLLLMLAGVMDVGAVVPSTARCMS